MLSFLQKKGIFYVCTLIIPKQESTSDSVRVRLYRFFHHYFPRVLDFLHARGFLIRIFVSITCEVVLSLGTSAVNYTEYSPLFESVFHSVKRSMRRKFLIVKTSEVFFNLVGYM